MSGSYHLEVLGPGAFRVEVVLLAQVADPQRQLRVVLFEGDVRQVELRPSDLFDCSFGLLAADRLH